MQDQKKGYGEKSKNMASKACAGMFVDHIKILIMMTQATKQQRKCFVAWVIIIDVIDSIPAH